MVPASIPLNLPPLEHTLRNALRRPGAIWLDSATGSGASWLAFEPTALLRCHGESSLTRDGVATKLHGGPLALLEQVVGPGGFDDTEFRGGWAGLLGFELRTSIEALPPPKPGGPDFPDLQAGFYPWVIRYHAGKAELRWLDDHVPDPQRVAAELTAALSVPPPAPGPTRLSGPALTTGQAEFTRDVQALRHAIRDGEIYQANLTREVVYTGEADPVELYLRLRRRNPAPYAGYLDCGNGRAVLSSSPEAFVEVHGGRITTRPIKGTRPRGSTPDEDARLRAELAASAKDQAELTMIVDLERNDLSRVCVPGSVKVPVLHGLHSFERVHHLQSTIVGELRAGVTPVEIIRAVFPGGSISGCPKKRALEYIHALEPVRRGPYTGCLFRLSPRGAMDSNILIRTLLVEPGRVSFHVGGGITIASDPEAEWQETLDKGAALVEVVEGTMNNEQ